MYSSNIQVQEVPALFNLKLVLNTVVLLASSSSSSSGSADESESAPDPCQ